MMELNILYKKLKKYYIDLDIYYGANANNKKEITIYSFFMSIILISMILCFKNTIGSEKYAFLYVSLVLLSELFFIFFLIVYDNPKNNLSNITKKNILKICIIIFLLMFFFLASPVLAILYLFNKIIVRLGIEIYIYNIHLIIINAFVYLSSLIIVINWGISYNPSNNLSYITYFTFAFFIYIVQKLICTFIEKKSKFKNYQEKYIYIYKSKNILILFNNILSMITSIIGIYASNNYIKYIFSSLIFFIFFDQIIRRSTPYKNEKQKFLVKIYEELVALKNIAVPQIKDYSNIKIRINLSINISSIEYYKNYFFENKKIGYQEQCIIDALNNCKSILSNVYNVYKSKDKDAFEHDLNYNIEELAKCITDMT